MQRGLGDGRRSGVDRWCSSSPSGPSTFSCRRSDIRFPVDLLERQAEDQVVGVRVVPVRARRVQQRLDVTVVQELFGRPLAERVGVELASTSGVPDHVVGVAGGHLGELAEGDLVAVRDLRQPLREPCRRELTLLLVDEDEEQRGDVGDGDGAVAEVHVDRGGYAGHRLAVRLGDDLLAVDGHPHDDRPEVASLHRLLHGPVDRRRLRRVDGRGCARRRALRGAAGEQPYAQRHDGEPPDQRHEPAIRHRTIDHEASSTGATGLVYRASLVITRKRYAGRKARRKTRTPLVTSPASSSSAIGSVP